MAQFSRNYLAAGGTASLSDYYATAYDGAVFDRQLRRNVVFADHSLATDTVFSEVHLVTARSGCSARRWCTVVSSAWAARSRCSSGITTMLSTSARANTACTGRWPDDGAGSPCGSGGGSVGGRRCRVAGRAWRTAAQAARAGAGRAAPAALSLQPYCRGAGAVLRAAGA
ncbi:hypothetical protein G6F40_014780 [Rhizopus arrhizus]|nr:hypothetical protein G6F40_014780 [Rhizopus arrhizus]